MNEFDMERMLARSQLLITILIFALFAGLIVAAGLKKIDDSYVKDFTPFVGIVIYYWFQRQRPHSVTDGVDANGHAPNPTPPAAAKP